MAVPRLVSVSVIVLVLCLVCYRLSFRIVVDLIVGLIARTVVLRLVSSGPGLAAAKVPILMTMLSLVLTCVCCLVREVMR